MRRFAVAAICTLALVGFVVADYSGVITKVDGNKVTAKKAEKKGKFGDEMEIKTSSDFKGIFKGKFSFDKDTKKATYEVDPDNKDKLSDAAIKDAVKDAGDKGAFARFITNDKDEVTQILLIQKKGGK
jgi:hypothetical protein